MQKMSLHNSPKSRATVIWVIWLPTVPYAVGLTVQRQQMLQTEDTGRGHKHTSLLTPERLLAFVSARSVVTCCVK